MPQDNSHRLHSASTRWVCALLILLSALSLKAQENPPFDADSADYWDALLLGKETLAWDEDSVNGQEENGAPTPSKALTEKELQDLTDEILAELELSPWQKEWQVKAGLGYTDNALLTAGDRQESYFSLLSLEFASYQLPRENKGSFFFYALGEHRHYPSPEGFRNEYLALFQGAYQKNLTGLLTWETALFSLYNDRVFGFSPLEDEFIASPIVLFQNSYTNQFEYTLSESWDALLTLTGERTVFRKSDDDYWQWRPELGLRKTWESGSIEAGLQSLFRDYDDRLQQDRQGFGIPNERLQWKSIQPYLHTRLTWGENNQYQWRNRVSHRWNRDNGPGYHDFERTRLNTTFRVSRSPWEGRLDAGIQHTLYPQRERVDGHRFRIWNAQAGFTLSRSLWENHAVELAWLFEESQSTRSLDGFTVHQTMLSYIATF